MLAKNVKFLKDIIALCDSFGKYLKDLTESGTKSVDVITVMTDLAIYSMDFLRLYSFFSKSDLTRKLNGFIAA